MGRGRAWPLLADSGLHRGHTNRGYVAPMENPYDLPWMFVGIASGVWAGSLRRSFLLRPLAQLLIVALGAFLCWRIALLSVDWAYRHPFNPNDGGAKTFVYLFGWVFGIVILILPSFACTTLARIAFNRRNGRGNAG
jgi:hypothetical protein